MPPPPELVQDSTEAVEVPKKRRGRPLKNKALTTDDDTPASASQSGSKRKSRKKKDSATSTSEPKPSTTIPPAPEYESSGYVAGNVKRIKLNMKGR
jgi:hypothetical protein